MFKKTLLILGASTLMCMALTQDDMLPTKITEHLELKKDKVYVIDLFASWCHSCKKELPLINKLNEQIDQNSTEIIGIDVDEKLEDAQAFQEEMKLNFRVVDDTNNELISLFDPLGVPAIFIVKNSKIITVITGAKDGIDSYILEGLKDLK